MLMNKDLVITYLTVNIQQSTVTLKNDMLSLHKWFGIRIFDLYSRKLLDFLKSFSDVMNLNGSHSQTFSRLNTFFGNIQPDCLKK